MKISEIYEKYKIMPNLQEHMLRVAGVASIICDNFSKKIEKKRESDFKSSGENSNFNEWKIFVNIYIPF